MALAFELKLIRALALILTLAFGSMSLCACDEEPAREGREKVVIEGRTFWLEPALDPASRFQGLSGRESIDEDGGMIFAFPRAEHQYFVMRDCVIDIDIAFLDPSGRVTAIHEMKVEEPQREGETEAEYNARLKQYSSKFSAQFVIEVRAGTLRELGLEEGNKVELDLEGLKARAR